MGRTDICADSLEAELTETETMLRRLALGSILYYRFVDQQNGNVVPHWIYAVALAALQALAGFLLYQRLFADRTCQNLEQFLGNHAGILRPNGGATH